MKDVGYNRDNNFHVIMVRGREDSEKKHTLKNYISKILRSILNGRNGVLD